MSKEDPSQKLLNKLPENPGYHALRRLEEQGLVELGEPVAKSKAFDPHVAVTTRITSSSDAIVSKLIEIDRQIQELDGMPDLAEAVHMALHIAQDALLMAALVRGAVPAPGHDPGAHYRDTLALTHLCMLGYPTHAKGKRAYVHDLLLDWAEKYAFAKAHPKLQAAWAEYFASVLIARVGTECEIEPEQVRDALNVIVTPEGRPKGSTRADETAETAGVKKWTQLHKLFGALRLAGPTIEGMENEIRETKKSMRTGHRLREL